MGSPLAVRHFAGHLSHTVHLDTPLRVAHLTDQHVGLVSPLPQQLRAVQAANEQKPDIVCITGDFVAHSQVYLQDLAETIRAFQAPVFAVLGNHDHWCGADDVARTLEHAGAVVLRNQHTIVEVHHQRLQIVGLDDAYTGHADAIAAARGLRADLPTIGLSHIAEEADHLWQLGVPLVLSGHTHAGQFTVARMHELTSGKLLGHKYVHGMYGERRGEGAVYVGAGIGAAMVPFRFGERAKREVTVFDLGTQPGALVEHHAEQVALEGRKPSEELRAKRHAAAKKKAFVRSQRRA